MNKEIIKCRYYDLMRAKAKTGQMYFTVDTRTLYKDYGNNTEQRLVFNAVILHSDTERLKYVKPSIGKFYYVEENNALWLFDTRWILKVADTVTYNTYYANDYVSPIINSDDKISGINGDIILDNNGLLGDGSVVVRDSERIVRGLVKSNVTNERLDIKSYLDDGMLIIPNAHLPYNDLSKSLGALHLTVEKKNEITSTNLDLIGCAHYYGDWNNYGNIYLTREITSNVIFVDYIPRNENEIIKFYITCTKTDNNSIITTHITIRPISETKALVSILSVNNENSTSVVHNDMGELVYTHSDGILTNITVEATRRIRSNDRVRISEYVIDNYNEVITIKQHKNSISLTAELGETWSDNSDDISIISKMWIKDNVLTQSALEKELENIKDELANIKRSLSLD